MILKIFRTGINLIIVIVLLCGEAGCSHVQNNPDKMVVSQTKKEFTLPDIPHELTSIEERADYLASHFWAHFDFGDTTLVTKPEITEQAFVDFLDVLSHVPTERGQKAVTTLMDSASVNVPMFKHFMTLTEKYLYDPNSPFRNEEFYIPVLRAIISVPQLDETYKVRPKYQLKTALKNRPGSVATDFVYTLLTGAVAKMSSIKADYTLLFFNNPDCHDCKRVKEYMKDSKIFNRMTQAKSVPSLCILAIYPDADLPLWKRGDYPKFMINGYDAGRVITNKELYDLKAIPTFYLLDREKKVILKDAPIEQIEAWLQMLINN